MIISNTTGKLAQAAFALAALSLSGSAIANEQARSQTVSHSDLDLAQAADVDTLDRRLDRAVKRVCGRASGPSLQERNIIGHCYDEAWSGITPQREFAIARAGSQSDRVAARDGGTAIQVASAN